jgi:sugar lactone lactonase YvrE
MFAAIQVNCVFVQSAKVNRMTLTPSPISSLNSVIVSRQLSLRLQTFRGLVAGCVLTAALIVGFGSMAVGQTAHFAGAQTTVGSGFYEPFGVAVDSSGNLYVADADTFTIYEILAVNGTIPVSPTIRSLARASSNPESIAVDSSGNVYYTDLDTNSDFQNNTVKEILAVNGSIPATPTINQVRGGFPAIWGLAVDKSGNVYVGGVYNAIPEIIASGTNFGLEDIGATSQSIPLSFTFDSAGTLGSTSVLTQGAAGLDFADAGTGTCKANTTYIYGSICTVNVIFTAKFAGTRYGAAVLKDGSGNVIAAGYVQGTGVGPQVNFLPGAQSTMPAAGLSYTGQVAVDGSGSLYITDWGHNRVLKETQAASTYTQSSIGSGFYQPMGIAVDGAGIVYIADTYNNRVVIETPSVGGYLQSVVGSGLSLPMRVAVDGSGNIYIADYGNQRVVKETLSAGVYTKAWLRPAV